MSGKPLAIDLFCGLGGWTEGLVAAGFDVIGFDITRHVYGIHRYPAQLVIQDVLTLHGSQFRDADLIVASPPCQRFSRMAMPWSRGKAEAAAIRADITGTMRRELTALFDASFRIQREAVESSGRFIPLVVENVCGAQPWVGRAAWHFGSYYLWGDLPALMPQSRIAKVSGLNWSSADPKKKGCFRDSALKVLSAEVKVGGLKQGSSGREWFDERLNARRKAPDGRKIGGDWFGIGNDRSPMRQHHPGSSKRAFASAMIAKIPLELSTWIGRAWYPQVECEPASTGAAA